MKINLKLVKIPRYPSVKTIIKVPTCHRDYHGYGVVVALITKNNIVAFTYSPGDGLIRDRDLRKLRKLRQECGGELVQATASCFELIPF